MKKIIPWLLFLFFSGFVFNTSVAQPFSEDIAAFKKQDSVHFPRRNAILFIGSSSFTKWKDVQNYFPRYPIINRGFGGSSLPDVIRYADDIIFPYHPKQIVIYCGENDLAASDTVTAQEVVARFKHLFTIIRDHYPKIPVAYISMKPSPSRKKLMPKFRTGNTLIKNYLSAKKNTAFIDVYHKMLDAHGNPIKYIFIEDSLHMNSKGYAIWQKAITPYLKK
jgi:lysophospholipase L1-like esterase